MVFLFLIVHLASVLRLFGRRALSPARPPAVRHRRVRSTAADAGMSTAEYAVGTLAAVAFASVLYAVVSSSATRSLISSVVQRALTVSF